MIDSLCQAYHWTVDEAFRMTMPQILMLNHAARVNHDRMMENMDKDRKVKDKEDMEAKKRDERDPILPQYGKRLSECTSDEIAGQFAPGRW